MIESFESSTRSSPIPSASARRRGHLRLLAYFVGLAIVCGGIGAWFLEHARDASAARWILLAAVLATALLGFLGVFVHRRTIMKIRWRETEEYLARIRRESAKYRALMEGAADMLLVVDPQTGAIRESNAQARTALGTRVERSERTGDARATNDGEARQAHEGVETIAAFLADGELASFRDALRRAVHAPGSPVSIAELRLRGVDGRAIVADGRFASIDLGTERAILVSLRDLTPQKEMERQLQIHERLSSIGLMTAGVAHEINNPLEGIGNYLTLLERAQPTDETRQRHLEMVRHGFARIRDIVRDLLRFARPIAGQGEADLAQVVERALKLGAYSEKFRDVRVTRTGLDAPLAVVGDPGRLEQVLFNLFLNAATAMQSKGSIAIHARRVRDIGGIEQVELAVEDTGPGIPSADLDRIFDPFFTSSEGTGLGLAVSYGIVRAHGGTITAENRAEGGARFTIRLPWPAATAATTHG